jgi:proteasome lid subunit RPN8/RPN11
VSASVAAEERWATPALWARASSAGPPQEKAARRSPVTVPASLAQSLWREALRTWPEECCGFLLAPGPRGRRELPRSLATLEPAVNVSTGDRRHSFLIPAECFRSAEERAERCGLRVAGVFHSHTDHPARPSAIDQENAWPGLVYLILSLPQDPSRKECRAFELDPTRREFREVPIAFGSASAEPADLEDGR